MNSSLINALQNHCVLAHVEDCDHYRIHGGLAVETDYIIIVSHDVPSSETTTFDTFRLSKTYAAFRIIVQQLKHRCRQYMIQQQQQQQQTKNDDNNIDNDICEKIIKNCTMIHSMIDTQRTTYLGKVNFTYVKVLAQQRIDIINHVVSILLCHCYPPVVSVSKRSTTELQQSVVSPSYIFFNDIANIIHTFILTDHLMTTTTTTTTTSTTSSSEMKQPRTVVTVPPRTTGTTPLPATVEQHNNNNNISNTNNPLLWIGDAVKNVATNVVSTTQTIVVQPILSGVTQGGGKKNVDHHPHPTTSTSSSSSNSHSTTIKSMSRDLNIDGTVTTAAGNENSISYVVPMSQRNRRTMTERDIEETTLSQVAGQEAKLLIDTDGYNNDHVVVSTTTISTSNDDPTIMMTTNQQRPMVPNYLQPISTIRMSSISTFGKWIDHNPFSFVLMAIMIVMGLRYAAKIAIDIDFDIFLLCIFASFCIGLHTPRPMILGYDDHPATALVSMGQPQQHPKKIDRSGRLLLRQSMAVSRIPTTTTTTNQPETSDTLMNSTTNVGSSTVSDSTSTPMLVLGSPMAMFPEGAELGSHLNCWSRPDPSIFQVRGPNYLHDKKKIPSSTEYIFPCRGLDLFLTDTCPQNVGQKFSNILMGGKLRDVPTLIINFRLPWGILLFYCEISTKFIPFLDASALYGTDEYSRIVSTKLQSILDGMTPGDRTVARWCMNNSEYKNQTLKIVPVVVDGPWVVKSVVGGKPAIIGAKLPISYVYQPSQGSNQAPYLEADLDIAASSAARGILSVARSYTQILTLNLGFVIQANVQDELPEQMLTGARLHGIDPLTAPSLPPMQDDMITAAQQLSTASTLTDEETE